MTAPKKTTIKDVAREANVSISVVSYVLNRSTEKSISQATKQRVMEAAARLNYVPNRNASGMRKQRALSIGLVSYWETEGTVFVHMLKGISEVTAGHNYSVVFCHMKSGQDSYSYLNYYLDGTIDGIIFISPHEKLGTIDEAAHIANMKQHQIPFVIINGHTDEPDVSYVNIDFYGSTYLATTCLFERGYQEITYVAPFKDDFVELKLRYEGYCDAIAHHHLTKRVCDVANIADGISPMKAVVANKSDTAHAVMEEARRQGMAIPAELAIIAANTEPYSSYLLPPLSTVRIPAEEMGRLAAQALLETIQGETKVVKATPACSLQIRESC